MKPGVKTTEFWTMVVVNLVAGLMLVGIIPTGAVTHDQIVTTVKDALEILTVLSSTYAYIRGRSTAKAARAGK